MQPRAFSLVALFALLSILLVSCNSSSWEQKEKQRKQEVERKRAEVVARRLEQITPIKLKYKAKIFDIKQLPKGKVLSYNLEKYLTGAGSTPFVFIAQLDDISGKHDDLVATFSRSLYGGFDYRELVLKLKCSKDQVVNIINHPPSDDGFGIRSMEKEYIVVGIVQSISKSQLLRQSKLDDNILSRFPDFFIASGTLVDVAELKN